MRRIPGSNEVHAVTESYKERPQMEWEHLDHPTSFIVCYLVNNLHYLESFLTSLLYQHLS